MEAILKARIPRSRPSPSTWTSKLGYQWRLESNRSRPNLVSLTLSFSRQVTKCTSVVKIRVKSTDIAQLPIPNLHVCRLSSSHADTTKARMCIGEASKCVKLPPICSPPGESSIKITVVLSVKEAAVSPGEVHELSCYDAGMQNCTLRTLQLCAQMQISGELGDEMMTNPGTNCIRWIDEEREQTYAQDIILGGCTAANLELGCHSSSAGTYKASEWSTNEDGNGSRLFELKGLLNTSGLTRFDGENNFADVTVVVECDGKKSELHVHRCVLGMASAVFRRMFSCQMREEVSRRVELRTFDLDTITIAIRHMYGERVGSRLRRKCFDVYRFGHQFEIESLLEMGQEALIENIAVGTCIEVFKFGLVFGDEKLRNRSLVFISKKFSEVVCDKDAFEQLCLLPAGEFLCLLESDWLEATELEIFETGMRWLTATGNEDEGMEVMAEVVRRVRWSLMGEDMMRTAMRWARTGCCASLLELMRQLCSEESKGRVLGRPMAVVCVTTTRRPAAAAVTVEPTRWEGRRGRGGLSEVGAESGFWWSERRWRVRAGMENCAARGCALRRLSVSMWLDEEEGDGEAMDSGVTVSTRVGVWNARGGQLNHRVVRGEFRRRGWAGGWCVQDVLGGHERTKRVLHRGRQLHAVAEVVYVGVEMIACHVHT